MRRQQATHVYIATAPCSCVRAAAVDLGAECATSVSEFIRDGCAVDRITLEEYRRRCAEEATFMSFDCPHKGPKQLKLGGS